ncbi:hypothetical protein [Cupriavidus basilensis]|uniref:hypothetical protein n=1 Tax=Cupriavidus basilensis TaxID=68895 RepID=UPI0002E22B59|nr:hypothetical protein [Cupriavidus basilensis]
MGKKVAEVIIEVPEQAGVKRCYGIVGDTLNLIADNSPEGKLFAPCAAAEDNKGAPPFSRSARRSPRVAET